VLRRVLKKDRRGSGDPVLAQKGDDGFVIAGESGPDGATPTVDGVVALRPSGRGEYIEDGHATAIVRQIDSGPLAFSASELDVYFLNLTTRKVSFQVEIEAQQAKHEGQGLGVWSCGLYRERVHDVLQDKARAAHGVDVDLVIGGTLGVHGNSVAKKGRMAWSACGLQRDLSWNPRAHTGRSLPAFAAGSGVARLNAIDFVECVLRTAGTAAKYFEPKITSKFITTNV